LYEADDFTSLGAVGEIFLDAFNGGNCILFRIARLTWLSGVSANFPK
jgi:hypothetical protein